MARALAAFGLLVVGATARNNLSRTPPMGWMVRVPFLCARRGYGGLTEALEATRKATTPCPITSPPRSPLSHGPVVGDLPL